jgi:hypothetical protein
MRRKSPCWAPKPVRAPGSVPVAAGLAARLAAGLVALAALAALAAPRRNPNLERGTNLELQASSDNPPGGCLIEVRFNPTHPNTDRHLGASTALLAFTKLYSWKALHSYLKSVTCIKASLISQGFGGIELRGAIGRQHSEDHPNRQRDPERHQHRRRRDGDADGIGEEPHAQWY